MRIGVDATCWANRRGYGRFARELVSAMVSRSATDVFVCFLDNASLESFSLEAPNVERVLVSELTKSQSRAASARGSRGLRDMLRMTRAVRKAHVDVFFSPSVYTYFPLPPGLPAVVTIHDAIPERFPALVFPSRKARLLWATKLRLAIFQARRVLTVSEYAARDLVRVLGIPRERIDVAVEAPSSRFRSQTTRALMTANFPKGSRWFVYVGGFSPHKNIPLAVKAHAVVARELGSDAPYLLLAGARDGDDFHTDVATIERTIDKEGTSALVKWIGYVEDDELSRLHSSSLALVLPSECEGFGLPAIEAAACGSPVVATRESPLPELLEGGGIFVTPGSEDELISALRRMATDTRFRESAASTARERAAALSWKKSAGAALDAIRQAVA
jgi:glycosyltransferase involved in cell wall biosynthesis